MERLRSAKPRAENEIEFSRIVAFSDGVFAIAITLLVLGIELEPGLPDAELWDAIWGLHENLIAYGISFAVIGRFWLTHHRFFGEVTAFDARLLVLNMLYLAFVVLIPFSSQVLGEYGGQTPAVVLYATNLAACVLVGLWMGADAARAGLTRLSEAEQRENIVRAIYIATVFLLAIPVAFVTPSLAPFLWLVLFFDPAERLAGRFWRDVSD